MHTTYEILGTVVERSTLRGVRGVRVEAWDRDTRFHDMLGSAITDGAGRFRIAFTDDYFGDFAPDLLPDVFYRVYRGDTLVLSTQDRPSENLRQTRIRVTLEIDPIVEEEVAPDRVNAETAIKALTFLRDSDFRGIGRETGEQGRLAAGLIGRAVAKGFGDWNWKPIGPSNVRSSDVVNRDTQTAQANLAAREVTVERVEPYTPNVNRGLTQQIAGAPVRLQPGEKVVLYEEEGVVKYYARVREEPAASIDQAEVSRLGDEVADIRADVGSVSALRDEVDAIKASATEERSQTSEEIADVRGQLSEVDELRQTVESLRAELHERNQTIASLQTELTEVQESQARIEQTNLTQRLDQLEASIRRLDG